MFNIPFVLIQRLMTPLNVYNVMPPHPVHLAYDTSIFGVPYGYYAEVHTLLDTGFVHLFGKDHRKILHDPESVEVIRRSGVSVTSSTGVMVTGDELALVCTHHIYIDSPTKYTIVDGRLVRNKRKRRAKK